MAKIKSLLELQIGKNGLTDSFIEQLKKVFTDRQRMKISILKSACRNKEEAKEICDSIVNKLGKNYKYKLVGYVCTLMKFKKEVRE